MKWVKRIAMVLGLLAVTIAIYAISTARTSDNPVGFQVIRVESANGPVAVALWYPTSATPRPTTFIAGQLLNVAKDSPVLGKGLPLIVFSHGNGGSALSHIDLAMELASAGYVVAAPTHTGDNYADQSRQGSPAIFSQRAEQLRVTIDHVLGPWAGSGLVDASRVGAFGFSAGGFTVLTLAGGVPDFARIPEHCRKTPEFICKALDQAGSPLLRGPEGAGQFRSDARIHAAVVAAPGLGFTFAGGGLGDVQIPVQVWSGDRDETVPYATNTRVVLEGLGEKGEPHQVDGASHLSFLAPCGLLKPPGLCSDPEGFDRQTEHDAMNAEIIRFFNAKLPTRKPQAVTP